MDRNIPSMILSRGVTTGVAGSSRQPSALLMFSKQPALLVESVKDPVAAAALGATARRFQSSGISLLDERLLDVRPPTRWGINE